MALKNTPVSITYESSSGAIEEVRFHAVISEEHTASAEITKYPTQLGYNVSNTAIRHNNQVRLEGIVTNYVLKDSDVNDFHSGNNSKIMFETLKSLVNNSVSCRVVTNLGIYDPVIFDKFRTKQASGSMDVLKFTLHGQETQISSSSNKTAPTRVSWKALDEVARAAKVDELAIMGFTVSDAAELATATVDMGTDFVLTTANSIGEAIDTTYISQGFDEVTGAYNYLVHTAETSLFEPVTSSFDFFSLAGDLIDVAGGVSTASSCLRSGAADILTTVGEDLTETAMGIMTNSIYGVKFAITGLMGGGGTGGGNKYGQALIGLGVDCIVAGGTTAFTNIVQSDDFNSSLPTVSDILSGATKFGKSVVDDAIRVIAPATFTKISNNTGAGDSVFSDVVEIP